MAEASLTSKCTAEFVGTFLLVFTVGCNVLAQTAVWAGVSIGCVLMVSIYAFGGISGANFNPAVTVSLGITKHMGGAGHDWNTVGIYCGVQAMAGIAAGICYLGLFGRSFQLGPAKNFQAIEAGLCEMMYTFMLCFVVLNVAVSKANAGKNEFYGLAIGFVIIAGAYGAGSVSGGCFNPAVSIGIDISSALRDFGWCIAYTFFQLIGASLAALIFKLVRPGDFQVEEVDEQTQMVAKLSSEFLGTFMLVLTVGLNVLGKSPAGAFSIGAALTSMVYALGDISGAHFNPAVTVSVLCSKLTDLTPKDAGYYVLAQVAAGISAAMMYSMIYHGESFKLGPKAGFTWAQVIFAEYVFTFVLCLIVLTTAVSQKTASKSMFGFAIGSCVTVGGFAIGGISGGSLNPAVSIGVSSKAMLIGGPSVALLYVIPQVLAGATAAAVVMVTHGDAEKKTESLSA